MNDALPNPQPWAVAAERLSQALAEQESTWAARCAELEQRLEAALGAAANLPALQARVDTAEGALARTQEQLASAAHVEAALQQAAARLEAQATQAAQAAAEARLTEATLAARLEAATLAGAQLAAQRDAEHGAEMTGLASRLALAEQALRDGDARWQAADAQMRAVHAQAILSLQADADARAAQQAAQWTAATTELGAARQALVDLQQRSEQRDQRNQGTIQSLNGDLQHVRQALLDERERHQSEVGTLRVNHADAQAQADAATGAAQSALAECVARLDALERMHRAVALEASARGTAVATVSAEAGRLRDALDHARSRRLRMLRAVRALRGLARANNAV